MTLHVPAGRNRYCGPGALAILTGCTTDQAAAHLRRVTGRKFITGAPRDAMLDALDLLGYDTSPAPLPPWRLKADPALEKWVAWRNLVRGTYLVVLTGHYVVVDLAAGLACDNNTFYPLPLARYRSRRCLVRAAWLVTRRP